MTEPTIPSAGHTGRIIGWSLGVAILLVLLGYVPTVRLAGADAVGSLIAGVGISWLVTLVVAVISGRAIARDPQNVPQAILLATGVRFLAMLAFAAAALLSGWFDRGVLVLGMGVSYLAMLAVDTVFATRLVKSAEGKRR